jgi:hypothetical protein
MTLWSRPVFEAVGRKSEDYGAVSSFILWLVKTTRFMESPSAPTVLYWLQQDSIDS